MYMMGFGELNFSHCCASKGLTQIDRPNDML
jgi:hypothetical protein